MARVPAAIARMVVKHGSGSIRSLKRHRNHGLELVYVSRGSLNWEVEGQIHRVTPESMFFTCPWQRHGSIDEFEPGHHWYYVIVRTSIVECGRKKILKFPKELRLAPKVAKQLARHLVDCSRHALAATPLLKIAMPQLLSELDAQGRTERVRFLLNLVLNELAFVLEPASRGSVVSTAEQRIESFRQLLAERCDQPWTLARMCSTCGLERTRFSELLKRSTGDSPTRLLNRLRVQRACQLLATTNNSICTVAFDTGFSSSQYFAETFRRFVGMSARAYRHSHSSSTLPRPYRS